MEIDPLIFRLSILFYQYLLDIMLYGGNTVVTYPLMSVTNAISSVIIVGAIIAIS